MEPPNLTNGIQHTTDCHAGQQQQPGLA